MIRTVVVSIGVLVLLAVCTIGRAAPQPAENGVEFNGATSYAVVENGKSFDLDTFTLAARVKPRYTGGSRVILNRGEAARLFTFYFHENKVRMLVEYRPGRYLHANVPVPAKNVWTHLAGTYDGKEIAIYVDGVRKDSVAAPGRISRSEAELYIGALSPGMRVFNGRLDDVCVWKRVLSEQEIGKVAARKDDITLDDGLVARWTKGSLSGEKWTSTAPPPVVAAYHADPKFPVQKADGYRGVWYQCCGKQCGEYVYKYSGGLGTYCAKHRPFAVYSKETNKTFFCFGGTNEKQNTLLHMVSYYDHATGTVPRPTILLDKHTLDAHDNPVISLDDKGHVWVFSSSHGTARPSYISVSTRPYSIDDFDRVVSTNYSYPQPYFFPGKGFFFLHTLYGQGRRLYQATSLDGRNWSGPRLLAGIHWGHYQISWRQGTKVGTALNYHLPNPKDGIHWRTNLYYMETDDLGHSWHNAAGEPIKLPLTEPENPALVHDYRSENLDVYMKDLAFDSQGRPVILHLTSGGWMAGPKNDPRTWRIVRWTGKQWKITDAMISDNNYDTGSLYVESDSLWRIIGPTEPGPQRYNTGGEVAVWTSTDQGATWRKIKQLTHNSQYNHTYCRKPIDAHPDFYALWADGHGREKSESRLYFTNRDGDHVWQLPVTMTGQTAKPRIVR